MYAGLEDTSPGEVTEISPERCNQKESCIKCGGIRFEYDKYFAEYICINCGFTTKENKSNVINEDCGTETQNEDLKDFSDQKFKKLKSDLSEELRKIENAFSHNIEKK
jgi:hypothetical protein